MKLTNLFAILLLVCWYLNAGAQETNMNIDPSREVIHTILPADGIVPYLPRDSGYYSEPVILSPQIGFKPLVNFFFRPETTSNYKEAGMREDTGHLNFYLRGDFGAKISLPKNIDLVANLQSYGVYTRSFGPLDQNLTLYEAYVDMKKLDRRDHLSVRFGRMSLGKYGTEILVGDDDFTKGRSFESVRFRYKTNSSVSDVMWVQLYQAAPDSAGFEWNHPIFLGNFNTIHLSDHFHIDANLIYIIDQFNNGYRTQVFMPDLRMYGNTSHLKYSAEVILQTGQARGIITDAVHGKVNANAVEASAGYFTAEEKFSVDATYYRGSGDDDPTDDNLKSYNVLWQNEHRRFGYIDAFKGSNVQAATLHINWNAGKLVTTGIHAVYANVLESKDRSTGIASIANLNTLNTDSKAIGIGADWYINYYFSHNLNMQLSASVFSPGDYFTAVNGIDKTMMRLYLMMALKI